MNDFELIKTLVAINSLAQFIVTTPTGEQIIKPMPVCYDQQSQCFLGHVVNNAQGQAIANCVEATLVLTAPSFYVSPSLFPEQIVPTMLYVSAQVSVGIEHLQQVAEQQQSLSELTAQFDQGWSVADFQGSEKRWQQMLSAIICLRLPVQNVLSLLKMGQHKSAAWQAQLRTELTDRQHPLLQVLPNIKDN